MVLGQLRVAVIGAQTLSDSANKPYTVFRTAVNFRGQCYQRLIRYRQFSWFHKRLHLRDVKSPEAKAIVFPGREWTRNASLQEDVVEARQVLLNEYMDKVTSVELTPGCYDRLLRLLKVGDYDVDPPQGHPVPVKLPARKDGHPSVEFHKEVMTPHEDAVATAIEQQQRRNRASGKSSRSANGATDQIGDGAATVVTPSVVFRSVTSIADTVLTDEERPVSTDGESSDDLTLTDDEQDSVRNRQSLTAAYAQQVVANRPKLRSSLSTPVRRVKKVKFAMQIDVKTAARPSPEEVSALRHTIVGDSSSESKFRGKVESSLSQYSADRPPLELLMSSQPAILARNRAETL